MFNRKKKDFKVQSVPKADPKVALKAVAEEDTHEVPEVQKKLQR